MGTENIQENIEKPKIEWGPELGNADYSWKKRLIELNSKLKKGEKPWRLPTESEILDKYNDYPEGNFFLSTGERPKPLGIWAGRDIPNIGFEGNHKIYIHLVRDTE
jgi:hypothetical protein